MVNIRRWLHEHSLKLLAIRDTPQAIAGGIAIGVFFGFMPIVGLKTLSAIFFAWLTGSNILAAVIAGTLHDAAFLAMPAVYLWEYKIGYWMLSSPHAWPAPVHKLHWESMAWHGWHTFFAFGKPLLLGGCVFSTPVALVSFFIAKGIVARHQRKKRAKQASTEEPGENPS